MQIQHLLKRIYSLRYNAGIRLSGTKILLTSYLNFHPQSQFTIGKQGSLGGRVLAIGERSTLTIGKRAIIAGNIMIGDDCSVQIGDNFRLIGDASLIVSNRSTVKIGKDCLIESVAPFRSSVQVKSGFLQIGDNGNIRGNVLVDGGDLSFGSNSFLNQGSEIRCEERIDIGDYVFISYYVDIFDTNTHSLDWRDRRQEVESGYPNSTIRSGKTPATAPIELGDYVWVGKQAAILKGCRIGAKSVVGTRSVVTTSCSEESLLVGNPASVTRLLFSENRQAE